MYIASPWVKVGFKQTGTIFQDLISKGKLDSTDELRLQLDGASDNVCNTNVYFCIWHLLYAQEHGLRLSVVCISRLIAGHTHFNVDQMFAIFSMYVMDKRSDARRHLNVYTLSEVKEALKQAHKSNLRYITYIGATWNFRNWLAPSTSISLYS